MVQLSDHENDADDILETDRDFSYVQDHDNDPDDVLDENSYVHTKYEHEDDTEDIPDGVNPINQELLFTKMQDHGNDTNDVPDEEASTLIGTSGARGTAMRRMDNEKAWDNFYKAGQASLAAEEDLKEDQWEKVNQMPEMPSTSYIQTKYEHEDDTEDVPEGVRPFNQNDLQIAAGHKKG